MLQEIVYNVLGNLDKIPDSEFIDDVLELIDTSSLSVFKQFFQSAKDFQLLNSRLPDNSYMTMVSKGVIPDMVGYPYSNDILLQFQKLLRDESATFQAIAALHSGDKARALHFLEFNKDNDNLEKPLYMEDVVDEYENFAANRAGIKTGVGELDEILKVLGFGSLSSVSAWTGEGKTTLGHSVLYHNVRNEGLNMPYFTFEVAQRDILFNLISREAYELGYELPSETLKKGLATPEDKEHLKIAQDSFIKNCKGKYKIITPTQLKKVTPQEVALIFKNLLAEWGVIHGFVWDYIQLMKFYLLQGVRDEKERMNFWVRFLQTICVDLNIAGILLSQLGRDQYKRLCKIQMADNSMFSEANEIERSSQVLMVILANEAHRLGQTMNIGISKHRNGLTHVKLMNVYANFGHNRVGNPEYKNLFSIDAYQNFQGSTDIDDFTKELLS